MRTPGFVWVLMAAGLFLPSLGWAEISGAKAIFASGEGPTSEGDKSLDAGGRYL